MPAFKPEFKGFDKNFGAEGRIAMVTGAAQGIGKACALLFAEKGADIVLVDVSDKVESVVPEIEARDVNVNSVSPVVVMTEMGKTVWTGEAGRKMLEKVPTGRFAYPEEVAACCVFLASDAADMITGTNLVIDGGSTVL